jgi:hypothetical protein
MTMIYAVEIGDIRASMDDDQNETAPMPDFAVDYLARCAQVAWSTYVAMVDADEPAEATHGEA